MSCTSQASIHAPHLGPLLGFTGQPRDPLTGCYHLGNGHRTYNPVLMRFHSADRLSPFGEGGINAYAYCVGDPVNRHDPSGRFPQFLGPLVSFAANTLGVIASGLRFKVLRNIYRSYNTSSPFPGSRSGVLATGTIDSRPPRPTAKDWALSTVSMVTGGAGMTVSGLRVAGAMEGDGIVYANMALTLVSLGSTAIEVFNLATRNPGFYPIDQSNAHFIPRPMSSQTLAGSRQADVVRIRGNLEDTRP